LERRSAGRHITGNGEGMHGFEVARVVKDYMEIPNVRRYVNQNGDGIDKESMWLV